MTDSRQIVEQIVARRHQIVAATGIFSMSSGAAAGSWGGRGREKRGRRGKEKKNGRPGSGERERQTTRGQAHTTQKYDGRTHTCKWPRRPLTNKSWQTDKSGGDCNHLWHHGWVKAAMSSDSNKSAHRASKLNLTHIDCLCFMDLWDHRGGVGALVGRFWP